MEEDGPAIADLSIRWGRGIATSRFVSGRGGKVNPDRGEDD